MVLNEIIEQAAGRQSRGSEHGGKPKIKLAKNRLCFIRCINTYQSASCPNNYIFLNNVSTQFLCYNFVYFAI